ncbi:MAG: TIGR02646 family protein [Gammaproteobacteria bacterium]|nr:TIGR02646 family protein [Gammaproteobacteria bacterium]
MRNVTRSNTPPSLHRHAARWRRELCAALSAPTPDPNRLKLCINRYKRDDIRSSLEQMYGGLCCYCEGTIGTVSFGHIEHRRPKDSQPQHAFDWNNMHLACTLCNHAKANKWNADAEILDSVHDRIPDHLSYRLEGARRWPETHRGATTIEHADLNRQRLLDARALIATRVLDTIGGLNHNPDSPDAGLVRQELRAKTSGEFGSLVQWLLERFLREAPARPAS